LISIVAFLAFVSVTALSYGIHGTPEPAKIGKTVSHGCIRLTNWDALDLAGIVHDGTVVKFEGKDSAAARRRRVGREYSASK
jgi:L,D-transpeptidase catalytic domain